MHRIRMRPLASEKDIRSDIEKEKAAIRRPLPEIGPLPDIDPIDEPAKTTPPQCVKYALSREERPALEALFFCAHKTKTSDKDSMFRYTIKSLKDYFCVKNYATWKRNALKYSRQWS